MAYYPYKIFFCRKIFPLINWKKLGNAGGKMFQPWLLCLIMPYQILFGFYLLLHFVNGLQYQFYHKFKFHFLVSPNCAETSMCVDLPNPSCIVIVLSKQWFARGIIFVRNKTFHWKCQLNIVIQLNFEGNLKYMIWYLVKWVGVYISYGYISMKRCTAPTEVKPLSLSK